MLVILCLASVFAISTSVAELSCSYKVTADSLMYGGVLAPVAGLGACQEYCTPRPDCKGFDLNPRTKECWTLKALPGLQSYKGVDHYDKVCEEVQPPPPPKQACDDNPCSQRIITEIAQIRDDVKSLVEGLRKKTCPEGFEYLPEVRSCYKLIQKEQKWSSANEICQSLAPGARLVSFESQEESETVTNYVNKQFEKPEAKNRCKSAYGQHVYWTSGHRVITNDCKSEFVWKTSATGAVPLTYKRWWSTEPNCSRGRENCLEILVDQRSEWNDIDCNIDSCFLCEYDLS